MILKGVGAMFIMVGFAYAGHYASSSYKKNAIQMQEFIGVLQFLECELQYRHVSLSSAFKRIANTGGIINTFFGVLGDKLEYQLEPDVDSYVTQVLMNFPQISSSVKGYIEILGRCIGKYSLESQTDGIHMLREECEQELVRLKANQDIRIRGYKAYSFCTGTLLVIILL